MEEREGPWEREGKWVGGEEGGGGLYKHNRKRGGEHFSVPKII